MRKKIIGTSIHSGFIAAILLLLASGVKAQVSPFQGLGQVQFFDNSGAPLTNGVLYSFQAGTSTQQATFTDSTGLIQNPNPIPFGTGARVGIWLTTANFYKFQLCQQNDGAFCSPGDILFSVDNVPGGTTGGGGGGGPNFTGVFISGTASPATSGTLRLASGDSVCWRNAAGSTNLCFKKDSNDLLSWDGGSLKLPEVGAPSGVAAFDILWADSTAHRLKAVNNAGTAAQYVLSGNDIGTTDNVTGVHFGATQETFGSTAPTTNQFLQFNGTNIVGTTLTQITTVYSTTSATTNAAIGATTMATAGGSGNIYQIQFYVTQIAVGVGCTGNTSIQQSVIWTDPNASSSVTVPASGNFTISGNGTANTPAFTSFASNQQPVVIRAKASTAVQYSMGYTIGSGCSTGPTYQVTPVMVQLQ